MERNRNYGADYQAPQEFRHPAIAREVGSETVPLFKEGERMTVNITPYKDHGRPAFVASTIKSSTVLVEAASSLDEKETKRLDQAFERTMDILLDDGVVGNSMAVMSARDRNKPDVFIINVGSSFSDSSLRLYCHIDRLKDAPLLIQDGRATKKGAKNIERELVKVGYSTPNNFGHNESRRGRKR